MTVDERSRLQLAEALKRVLGDDEGITLMELLPPVGWADVATKHDLLQLEQRMELRFESTDHRFESFEHRMIAQLERGLRTTIVTMMSLYITGFAATILAVALTR